MSETRVVTPGNSGPLFGFVNLFFGSMDDNTLKGNTLVSVLEQSGSNFQFGVSTTEDLDFIGQQALVGETVYFLKDVGSFTELNWRWPPDIKGNDLEDAFNASETVTVIFDFRAEQYTTPELVTPYGNQGTLVGDTVSVDLNPNFVLANSLVITNLPPGLSETDSVVTGTLTDNTGPFEVVVTATNSLGTTKTTFTWNTYRLNTNTRIITSGQLGGFIFGYASGLIGSIDDDNLKGNIVGGCVEINDDLTITLNDTTDIAFIGQQLLVGETTYFVKDVSSFDGVQWIWPFSLTGTDLEDGFNSSTPVPVVFNISNTNTIFNSATNSDINTPIPFPAHFDNR